MTTETPAETPVEDVNPEPTDPDTAPEDDKPGKEAAKYRRQLRETETERDTLRERVEALQRATIDGIASAKRIKPEALWASGVELESLLTESGTVDHDKVGAAIVAAVETLGLNARRGPVVPEMKGSPTPPANRSFADAFAPKH